MHITELIEELKTNPDSLYQLSEIQFEDIVAELLHSFGWRVNLSQRRRDGGVNMFATSKDKTGIETSWIIECKKYNKDKKVNVELIRQLYETTRSLRVSNVVLITTSTFSKEAVLYANQLLDIKLLNFQNILEWVENYTPPPVGQGYVEKRNFFSCFISYSHKDQEFTELLYSVLRENNILVWYAPEDLKAGRKIDEEISNAIKIYDKLLIVLSENSMKSEWVQSEIRKAKKRELKEGVRVLFPISLVSYDDLKKWELFDADSGRDLAIELREYYIPNFSSWENSLSFKNSFKELLKGLSTD